MSSSSQLLPTASVFAKCNSTFVSWLRDHYLAAVVWLVHIFLVWAHHDCIHTTTLSLQGGSLQVPLPKELMLRLQDLFPSDGLATATTLNLLNPSMRRCV